MINQKDDDITLIERHLSGRMSQEELVEFEDRLEQDHEFARKFRLRKSFPSLFNAEGEDMITEAVQKLKDEQLRERKDHAKKGLVVLLATGILALGILAVLFITGTFRAEKNTGSQETVTQSPETPAAVKPAPARQEPPPATPPEQTEQTEQPAANTPDAVTPGKIVLLENPENGKIFRRGEEINFQWKMDADTFTRICVISDPGERIIWWRGIIPGIQEYKVDANTFRPGKFQWYIGTKEVKRTFVITE
jgi:hypothetical protein